MIFPTEDTNLECSPDRTLIARVLTPLSINGLAIHPATVDIGGILKDTTLRIGRIRAGDILVVSRDPGGLGISAKLRFDDTDVGRRCFRLYSSKILWSFTCTVEIRETRPTDGDPRFPEYCTDFAVSASLRSIGIDPFAPL